MTAIQSNAVCAKYKKEVQWGPYRPQVLVSGLNCFFVFLGIYQLKHAKSYTIEHLSADGKYAVKIGKHRSDTIKGKIQLPHKNSTSYDV